MLTVSIIKADTGGFVGHSAMPPDMLDAARKAVDAVAAICSSTPHRLRSARWSTRRCRVSRSGCTSAGCRSRTKLPLLPATDPLVVSRRPGRFPGESRVVLVTTGGASARGIWFLTGAGGRGRPDDLRRAHRGLALLGPRPRERVGSQGPAVRSGRDPS